MSEQEARAAVERAEHEPLLGHRTAAVRAAIDAAAPLLEREDFAAGELRARLFLRLASVQLVENDYDGADQALEAVTRYAPDARGLRILAGVRACRVALRRGPAERSAAASTVRAAAEQLDTLAAGTAEPLRAATAAELVLAIAELAIHDQEPPRAAIEPLEQLVSTSAGDRTRRDVEFAARQLLATDALARGDFEQATRQLRALVALARDAGSPADEIEARLALATTLADRTDPVSTQEAAHHVHAARDAARAANLRELAQAALLAEAGLLARAGKTAEAIDKVIALARDAAAAQDVSQYVAAVGVMAELYARTGDHVSAFRTIGEANHALSKATGGNAAPLFRPLLARLRDRIGAARLEEIAADVAYANELAGHLAAQKSKNPN